MGDSGAAKPVRSVSRARMTTEGWCSAVNAWMGYCRAKKGIYTTYTRHDNCRGCQRVHFLARFVEHQRQQGCLDRRRLYDRDVARACRQLPVLLDRERGKLVVHERHAVLPVVALHVDDAKRIPSSARIHCEIKTGDVEFLGHGFVDQRKAFYRPSRAEVLLVYRNVNALRAGSVDAHSLLRHA
jgi:hypothetical protein